MYRTSHKFPTLKNTVKVLHTLNELMRNDKQIAFKERSFQPFSGKNCNNYAVSKNNFVECLNPHFVFVGYFAHNQIAIMT